MHQRRRSGPTPDRARWNWRRRLAELLLLPAGYWLYAAIRDREGRAERPVDFARAQVHGEQLMRLEGDIGLSWERATQAVFLHWPAVLRVLDSFWSYGYLVVTIAVVIAALCQRPPVYWRLRNTFGLTTFVAITAFAAYPSVPPRLLPASYGLVDTWVQVGGVAARNPPRIEQLSDPFASFPSIHVAWATWCVVAVWSMTRHRWMRAAAGGYLALTVLAVVATGNHYLIDCVVGAGLTLVALAAVIGAERLAGRAALRSVPRQVAALPPTPALHAAGLTAPPDQVRESSSALTA